MAGRLANSPCACLAVDGGDGGIDAGGDEETDAFPLLSAGVHPLANWEWRGVAGGSIDGTFERLEAPKLPLVAT